MTKPSIDQNRKTITTLWANGTHDAYTIHELTSISLSTIYNYIKKLENGESLDHKPRSGRPRKLLAQQCPKLLYWPSNSPDLNPIENLWQILKTRVEKQVNEMLVKKQTVTVEVFRGVIQKEWEEIDQSTYCMLIWFVACRRD